MNFLEQIESDEFRDFVKEQMIEYKNVNGIQTVDENFISEVLNRDPIDFAEKFFKERGIEANREQISGLGLITMQLNRIIKEEIAALTHDVKFGGTYKQYMDLFKMHGFDVIYDKEFNHQSSYDDEPRKENEVFLWHKENGMLIHMDSHTLAGQASGNSVKMYCQGIKKEPKSNIFGQYTRNVISCTDYHTIQVDMRDLPSSKISEILKDFTMLKEWREISSTNFYSYLTHDKKEGEAMVSGNVWKNQMFEKINSFPNDVKESILSKLSIKTHREEDILNELGYSKDYFKVKDILETISEDDLEKVVMRDLLFNLMYTDNHAKTLDDKMFNLFKENGVDNPRDFNQMIISKARKTVDFKIEDNMDKVVNYVNNLGVDDLKLIHKELKQRVEMYLAKDEEKQIFELVNKNIQLKESRKNNTRRKMH